MEYELFIIVTTFTCSCRRQLGCLENGFDLAVSPHPDLCEPQLQVRKFWPSIQHRYLFDLLWIGADEPSCSERL